MGKFQNDDRFKKIKKDKRFRLFQQNESKVKVDDRFSSMFTKKQFQKQFQIDKRGKSVTKSSLDELKNFFVVDKENKNVSPDDDDDDDEEKTEEEEENDDDEDGNEEEEEEEEEEEVNDEIKIEGSFLDLVDENNIEMDEMTSRFLAICNCKWDVVKSVDLFALFTSFIESEKLLSISVYRSSYGIKELEKEAENGPTPFSKSNKDPYELRQLKYYFAVAIFADDETAIQLYNECDGLEFETSGNRLDLRFINNDDMYFDESNLDNRITMTDWKSQNLSESYEAPPTFYCQSLSNTILDNSLNNWDCNDLRRQKIFEKIFDDDSWKKNKKKRRKLEEDDELDNLTNSLSAYIAPPSSDEESEELQTDINDMNEVKKKVAILSKQTQQRKPPEKKRNIERKEKSPIHVQPDNSNDKTNNEEPEEKNHFLVTDLVKFEKLLKKKKKSKKQQKVFERLQKKYKNDKFEFNSEDNRFMKELNNNHLFHIDPTSSQYHATPAMKNLMKR
ncbi:hypothetical protein SNEBB_004035 [Seison nebaliae]|nr:hypothetical protein SNEBB_004035 [Seison nebaliae]